MGDGKGSECKRDVKDDFAILPESEGNNESKSVMACLVGKLWIDKSFNIRAFMNTIEGVRNNRKGWRPMN